MPARAPAAAPRRPLTRRLVRAAGEERASGATMRVESLLATLGDRSLGWCMVLFAIVNLIPMPLGGMITGLPLLLIAGQMALGVRELRLPAALMRREIGCRRFQRVVMQIRPLMRPIERIVRPRREGVFTPRNERLIGGAMFAVAFALFLPLPLSGYLPAASLLVTGFGLVERDGLVVLIGIGIGIVSVLVTAAVGTALFLGVQFLAG